MTDHPAAPSPPPPPPAPPPAGPPPAAGWSPPAHTPIVLIIASIITLLGVLCVLAGWRLPPFNGAVQRTENAYVRGRVTVISPQVSGYVTEVLAQDYQNVVAGAVLVRIDDRPYRRRVEQAQAQLDAQIAALDNSVQAERARRAAVRGQDAAISSAAAQLTRAQADLRRVNDLVTDGSVSKREQDQTIATLQQAEALVRQSQSARDISQEDVRTVTVGREGLRANVEAARASLNTALIDLEHTVIRAPEDGRLNEIGVRLGQYVTNGSQLLFLVPPHPWIIANYKEAQTARMAPGQSVMFSVDALAGQKLHGRVQSLAPAAGSEFAVLKPDNATGNFTKVPQRIGVRILVDEHEPLASRLRPGMSVVTSVDTGASRP